MSAKDNDQTDLLVSIPNVDGTDLRNTNNGKVSLHMSHALTRGPYGAGDNVQGKQVTVFSMQATKKASTLIFRILRRLIISVASWSYINPIEMITVSPLATLPFAVPAVKDEKKLLADFFPPTRRQDGKWC